MMIIAPIQCLDHGYVKLISHMGDDSTIVAAARNSIAGDNVKATSDDRALIRFLMRHRHTTPFEAVVITFEMQLPIFVARQLVRHRTQSLNEMSARYGEIPETFYVPEEKDIQYQADKNKQGRKDLVMENAEVHRDAFRDASLDAFGGYRNRLAGGMARELARINLPLSTYTKWWATMNLHNLFHLLGLRKDPHAQYETRVFADAMGEITHQLVPHAWEAFCDFRLNAMTLSASDIDTIREMVSRGEIHSMKPAAASDDPLGVANSFKTKRESQEFLTKFQRLFG